MSKAGKFELNTKAIGEILNGPDMEQDLTARLNAARDVFGDGAEVSVVRGRNRIQASLAVSSREAKKKEERTRGLERAAGNAGGNSGSK